jgi:hypothetical protein
MNSRGMLTLMKQHTSMQRERKKGSGKWRLKGGGRIAEQKNRLDIKLLVKDNGR